MENIQVSRVIKEKYDDIKWYLDSIIPYVNFLNDLCFVDYEGIRYMVTRNENQFVIVAYENGELNPYSIVFDDNGKPVLFSTESCIYELSLDFGSGVFGVKKDNKLSDFSEQLVYFPKDSELDKTSLDFYQVYNPSKNCCIMSYEFPDDMTDINYGLNYAGYHEPSKIVLLELKRLLGIINYTESNIFFKTSGLDVYRKNLIRLHNILIPKPFVYYDPKILLEEIEKAGYKREIPTDMKEMIKGTSPMVKRLEIVSKAYDEYTKGQ